ncbi:hypothetical protein NHX12_014933 [Muraenolepis orangiensis]|uniref:X-linked retinitis pigmentosa GTPase regulator n=1 Tax=Muraenolepis orangiensis TaxID=630683 RepID=A0A9Q0D9H4_9TELE|nr:hypothetical protein NHX12_014933 [Muraenolepis orangiensis]
MAGEAQDEIPESGAVFTFGKSKFADNMPSKFWLKHDVPQTIACGDEHTAVVTENGKLFVFGSNNWGQLGLGTKSSVNKPTCVKALKSEKVRLVACGRNHTIICTAQGTVYTSGGNSEGQLGLGDCDERKAFQPVKFFGAQGPIKMLAAGSNTSAALTEDGKLFMWGDNTEGQIGLGQESNACTPREVSVGQSVAWVSCGYYHSAFVTAAGGLYTFGERDSGKLGLGPDKLPGHRAPQLVRGITGRVTQVACGGGHTVAHTEEGVYTFGLGQFGQLGHGTFVFESSLPHTVDHFRRGRAARVSCGENHTAVITESGLLYTFGDGRHGKLGLGEENFTNQFKPTLCPRFLQYHVQAVTCGGCHLVVLARPRDPAEDPVTLEEDDERSPDQFGAMFRNVPLSSRTPEADSVVEDLTDTESVKGLGDTADFLNMTHMMKLDPHDQSLTLSPVQKQKGKHANGKAIRGRAEKENQRTGEAPPKRQGEPLTTPQAPPSTRRPDLRLSRSQNGRPPPASQSLRGPGDRQGSRHMAGGKENVRAAVEGLASVDKKGRTSKRNPPGSDVGKSKARPRPSSQGKSDLGGGEGNRETTSPGSESKAKEVIKVPRINAPPSERTKVKGRPLMVQTQRANVDLDPGDPSDQSISGDLESLPDDDQAKEQQQKVLLEKKREKQLRYKKTAGKRTRAQLRPEEEEEEGPSRGLVTAGTVAALATATAAACLITQVTSVGLLDSSSLSATPVPSLPDRGRRGLLEEKRRSPSGGQSSWSEEDTRSPGKPTSVSINVSPPTSGRGKSSDEDDDEEEATEDSESGPSDTLAANEEEGEEDDEEKTDDTEEDTEKLNEEEEEAEDGGRSSLEVTGGGEEEEEEGNSTTLQPTADEDDEDSTLQQMTEGEESRASSEVEEEEEGQEGSRAETEDDEEEEEDDDAEDEDGKGSVGSEEGTDAGGITSRRGGGGGGGGEEEEEEGASSEEEEETEEKDTGSDSDGGPDDDDDDEEASSTNEEASSDEDEESQTEEDSEKDEDTSEGEEEEEESEDEEEGGEEEQESQVEEEEEEEEGEEDDSEVEEEEEEGEEDDGEVEEEEEEEESGKEEEEEEEEEEESGEEEEEEEEEEEVKKVKKQSRQPSEVKSATQSRLPSRRKGGASGEPQQFWGDVLPQYLHLK